MIKSEVDNDNRLNEIGTKNELETQNILFCVSVFLPFSLRSGTANARNPKSRKERVFFGARFI
jgi:hypothetical protein